MIICICGPSSIGKTKLSIMLAKKYRAIIINADATQVYQKLNIGSAKITEEEKENIKHYLIDIKEPNEKYSVADFQKEGRQILDNNKDKNIIVVGGTGLYISALFNDYNFGETKGETYENYSNEELYNLALKKDKNMQINQNNRVRLINFLNKEKIENNKNQALYDVVYLGLTMPREKIYENVNKRVDKMLEMGLLEEVKSLYTKYPDSQILKRAIGYKELISYLNKEISYENAIELIKKNTRHYVKRQYTWFNNQLNVKWFNVQDEFNDTYEEIIQYITSLNSK